jgi:hypothetical protein
MGRIQFPLYVKWQTSSKDLLHTSVQYFALYRNKALFILLFCKTNSLQEQHAAYFGITQPQANKMIHFLFNAIAPDLKRTTNDSGTQYNDAIKSNFERPL